MWFSPNRSKPDQDMNWLSTAMQWDQNRRIVVIISLKQLKT